MLHFLTIFVCYNKLYKLPLGIMHKHFKKMSTSMKMSILFYHKLETS